MQAAKAGAEPGGLRRGGLPGAGSPGLLPADYSHRAAAITRRPEEDAGTRWGRRWLPGLGVSQAAPLPLRSPVPTRVLGEAGGAGFVWVPGYLCHGTACRLAGRAGTEVLRGSARCELVAREAPAGRSRYSAASPKGLFHNLGDVRRKGRCENSILIAFHYSTHHSPGPPSAALATPPGDALAARLWDPPLKSGR